MAISPPSDILLDVATAADPVKVRAATARLAELAADPNAANVGFSDALAQAKVMPTAGSIGSPATVAATSASRAAPAGATHNGAAKGKASVYTKFEAVLLQNFIESMLPQDSELFGDKNSAGVYRSMMAEQLANQVAAAGGIGIAKALETAHPAAPRPVPGGAQGEA